MICCKECLELLHDYIEGELSAEVHTSLEDHLEDCPPCIAFLSTYKATIRMSQTTLKSNEIPDIVKERLKEFVDKNKAK
jgi:anti-sigma factor RsiW